MRYFMAAVLVIAMSTALSAQEGIESCDCEQHVQTTDATCSSSDCISPDNCASIQFTASCTGRYTVSCGATCSGSECSDYNSCVNIYENGSIVAGSNCHLNPCSDCGNGITVCLFAGHTYTLYVCLTTCTGAPPCPSPATCTAKGSVDYCGPSNLTCQ